MPQFYQKKTAGTHLTQEVMRAAVKKVLDDKTVANVNTGPCLLHIGPCILFKGYMGQAHLNAIFAKPLSSREMKHC